jgi:hypothetical protein
LDLLLQKIEETSKRWRVDIFEDALNSLLVKDY